MGKFKKGDRVQGNSGYTFDPSSGTITDVRENKTVYVEVDGQPGRAWCYRKNQLKLIKSESTTFKIEAGKFYKTLDGRKVGPMAAWPDEEDCFKSSDLLRGGLWKTDGGSYFKGASDSPALIAEWVDEPAAKASTSTPSNDNAKPKLKVGDRISGSAPAWGTITGVITAFDTSSPTQTYMIKDDESGHTMWIDNYSIVVPAPTPTTIVTLIENGQPKPSSTPHVHTSTGAAETEAKRLAAKYKGKQFGVFTLTTTHEEAAPVYDHKWQNMAALGLKIDAIKELRALSGLGLKSAKDAVEHFLAAA